MRDFDLTKIFDSMKTNEISELVIKDGGKLYEIRRGGFKQNVIAGSAQVVSNAPQQIHTQMTHAAPNVSNVQSTFQTSGTEAKAEVKQSNYHEVKSPLVGTYYASPKPDAPSFVEVGTKVTKGQTLCIVEAMKNFNEIDSDIDGIVKEILCKSGDLVEFGKTLFRIE